MNLVGKIGSRRSRPCPMINGVSEGCYGPKWHYGHKWHYGSKGDDRPNIAARSSKTTEHVKKGRTAKAPIDLFDSVYIMQVTQSLELVWRAALTMISIYLYSESRSSFSGSFWWHLCGSAISATRHPFNFATDWTVTWDELTCSHGINSLISTCKSSINLGMSFN